MKFEFNIVPPTAPDYITLEMPAKTKQEGFNPDGKANQVPIQDLTEEQIDEYADSYKSELRKKWRFLKHQDSRG